MKLYKAVDLSNVVLVLYIPIPGNKVFITLNDWYKLFLIQFLKECTGSKTLNTAGSKE